MKDKKQKIRELELALIRLRGQFVRETDPDKKAGLFEQIMDTEDMLESLGAFDY